MTRNSRTLNNDLAGNPGQILALSVTFVMKLCPLWDQSFTTLLSTSIDDRTPILRLHSDTKSVLALAAALGGLISAFHSFRKNW